MPIGWKNPFLFLYPRIMTLTRPLYLYEPSSPLNLDLDVNFEQENSDSDALETAKDTTDSVQNIDGLTRLTRDLQTEHASPVGTRKRHYSTRLTLSGNSQTESPEYNSEAVATNDTTSQLQNNLDKCPSKRARTDVDNVKLQQNKQLSMASTSAIRSNGASHVDSTNTTQLDDHNTSTIEFSMIFDEHDYSHEANDVFGLGLFREECITDEDMQQSLKKLGEEMAKSQRELALEAARRLIDACASNETSPTLSEHYTISTNSIDFNEPVLLCHNSLIIGSGRLSLIEDGVLWQGQMLVESSCNDDSSNPSNTESLAHLSVMGYTAYKSLVFTFLRLSDVRVKCIPDEPVLLLITYDDSQFIQFAFLNEKQCNNNGSSNRSDSGIVYKILEQIQSRLAYSLEQQRNNQHTPIATALPSTQDSQSDVLNTANTMTVSSSEASLSNEDWIPLAMTVAQKVEKEVEQMNSCLRQEIQQAQQIRDNTIRDAYQAYLNTLNEMKQKYLSTSKTLVGDDNDDSHVQLAECQLCYANKDTHIIRPCNHRLCGDCAIRLQESSVFCPWDRDKYTLIQSLFDSNIIS
ncbi:hypothetical protein BDF22DRAFT_694314 [Syncephalis plumigaleata]|nr:hypothetical protein BDF22DRAFT_694314 [Syncephalis plumigaleata]